MKDTKRMDNLINDIILTEKIKELNGKNYLEEGLKNGIYEVQKDNGSETLYSIFNKLISDSKIPKENLVIFRGLLLDGAKQGFIDSRIYPGNKIEVDFEDGNSLHLSVNGELYIMNIANYTINNKKVKKEK